MSYKKHLYCIIHPNYALVASQLEPEDFGRYYSVGTARYYSGKMVFVEVDINYRNEYFPIDEYLALTVEHSDGTPKMTKFISSYRVLEHVPLEAMQDMFVVTTSGEVLCIHRQSFTQDRSGERVRIIQELNPISLLVASTYDPISLGEYLTTPGNPRGCPTLCFTQIDLDVRKFLADWAKNPFMSAPIPGVHPQKLSSVLEEMLKDPKPRTKSIGIQSIFDRVSYNKLIQGFFVARGTSLIHYPMPPEEVLKRDHYTWWKHCDT